MLMIKETGRGFALSCFFVYCILVASTGHHRMTPWWPPDDPGTIPGNTLLYELYNSSVIALKELYNFFLALRIFLSVVVTGSLTKILKFYHFPKNFFGLQVLIEQQWIILSASYREVIQPAVAIGNIPESNS